MKATSHLATTLTQLEFVSEACGLRRRVVDVQKLTLGADDPRTLSSLENLATTLLVDSELDEAAVVGRSLLEKRVPCSARTMPTAADTRAAGGDRPRPGLRLVGSDLGPHAGQVSTTWTIARTARGPTNWASQRSSWPSGPDLASTPFGRGVSNVRGEDTDARRIVRDSR